MTPAGVGNLLPGDSKTALIRYFTENLLSKLISKHCPRRQGNHPAKPQQARLLWQNLTSGTYSQKQNL
jgi:hypothetical protein